MRFGYDVVVVVVTARVASTGVSGIRVVVSFVVACVAMLRLLGLVLMVG